MNTRFFGTLALVTSSFACSSSSSSDNTPPVVDAFEMPATATIGATGNYELTGKLSAHDPDGVIHQILIEIPGYTSPTLTVDRQSIVAQAFTVQIDGRSKKGPLGATAKIVDDQGGTTSQAITVTLE